jgi:Protein of unknown function (DUF3307)
MSNTALLMYLALLFVKHNLADLNLQGRIKGNERAKLSLFSRYNTIHSADHAVLGFVVTVLFAPIWLAMSLAVLEFFCHYAIDHAKSRLRWALNLSTKDRAFWQLQGADQIAHTLWYVAMAWIVLTNV